LISLLRNAGYAFSYWEARMRFAYVLDSDITYYRRIMKGVAEFAQRRGGLVVQAEFTSRDALRGLDKAGFDGIILGTFRENSEEVGRLRTPAISVSNTHQKSRFAKVVTDDYEVGRIAARHLLYKGHRNFAFWGHDALFAEERWGGFESAVRRVRGADCLLTRTVAPNRSFPRWLARLPRPLGLMTSGDDKGFQAINACHALGWRIPEDVAVVGVDDNEIYSEMTSPPLSSIALQNERIGFLAASCLVRLLEGKKIPWVTLVPPGPMMARRSSHAMVVADVHVARAVHFLEENLSRHPSVADVAKATKVSRRSLELRFKNELGRTPGQELANLRLERARRLLATTSIPLKQVAIFAGYSGSVRMCQVFRMSTGQTPTQYRRGYLPN
jgi:LacI family transcriptional regulator